jgi:sensor c-di-GMP phosphodiesterase-like protein
MASTLSIPRPPMDMMKVDLSFDIEMETSEGVAQVNTLIVIAHALKLKVIAEGV